MTNSIIKPTVVWVNGRFLGRPITGVERVAREILTEIAESHLDENGRWSADGDVFELRIMAPAKTIDESPWPNIRLQSGGVLRGHAWEQLELPRLTAGELLLNLCNTAPILKKHQIVFLHDAQTFAIPENFSRLFRSWYRFMFYVTARTAQSVLVNSRFTQRELSRCLKLPTDRMRICYPGSEHAVREKAGDSLLSRFNLPTAPFVLGVASENPNKNFAQLVNALKSLGRNAPPCVLVGRSSQKHFRREGLDDSGFIHLGYVSDRELLALYKRALCLVFPSYYEGFGLPPLEAMRAGCPVVVSATSSMPEVAGSAAEYCNPDDHTSIAGAILRVNDYRSRRDTMVRDGKLRAVQFSWTEAANCVLDEIRLAGSKASAKSASPQVSSRETWATDTSVL